MIHRLMFENAEIKGIIFDYGGTLDSRGDHWSEVILDAYHEADCMLSFDDFRPAYIDAERYLASHFVVKASDTFADLMHKKIALQCRFLSEAGTITHTDAERLAPIVADRCYAAARDCTAEAEPILSRLAERYPMALVSNFYGNIDAVLRDMGIRKYFRHIVESAVIGIRKPDPRIFAVGCLALDMQPEHILVVGDSLSKDIRPARSLGCHTAWIKGRQWRLDNDENLLAEKSTTLDKIAQSLF